ncbi:MAG: acyltransferase [Flavobacterium sp.]|nr:acyltransferase [Flavobacterium sp.]
MKFIYYISYLYKGVLRKISHKITDWSCKNDVVFDKGTRFTMTAKVENISKNIKNITIGKNTIIEGKLMVFNYGGKISIGKNVYVGVGTNIRSGELITIWDNVLISHNVNIIDTDSHEIDHFERIQNYNKTLIEGSAKVKGNVKTGKIKIENYVWISFGVTILKNITIGEGAIIAANSVVTKDVPAFSLVAGSPAKVIKSLLK